MDSELIALLTAPAIVGFFLAVRLWRTYRTTLFLALCALALLAPVAAHLDAAMVRPEQYLGYEDHFAVAIPALAVDLLGTIGLVGLAARSDVSPDLRQRESAAIGDSKDE